MTIIAAGQGGRCCAPEPYNGAPDARRDEGRQGRRGVSRADDKCKHWPARHSGCSPVSPSGARDSDAIWALAFLADARKGGATVGHARWPLPDKMSACLRGGRLCCLMNIILARLFGGLVNLELETQSFEAGQFVAGHGGVPLVASLSRYFPGERCECLTGAKIYWIERFGPFGNNPFTA